MKPPFTADYYVQGILKKDRIILSKAITLIESTLPADMELANQVLERCLRHQQKSRRIAISGPPGAGKSTFIN
ncbi:MAG TPA: methylmalonyl Co-A mutase-associated GTPase MeaB, partial [Chitinophagales bacterium]|nr:methylmalonyl Co-A mutase-associated GTPase MeaB [Chitinophagales bacterium]